MTRAAGDLEIRIDNLMARYSAPVHPHRKSEETNIFIDDLHENIQKRKKMKGQRVNEKLKKSDSSLTIWTDGPDRIFFLTT